MNTNMALALRVVIDAGQSEEMRHLRSENGRLRSDLANEKAELSNLREENRRLREREREQEEYECDRGCGRDYHATYGAERLCLRCRQSDCGYNLPASP